MRDIRLGDLIEMTDMPTFSIFKRPLYALCVEIDGSNCCMRILTGHYGYFSGQGKGPNDVFCLPAGSASGEDNGCRWHIIELEDWSPEMCAAVAQIVMGGA